MRKLCSLTSLVLVFVASCGPSTDQGTASGSPGTINEFFAQFSAEWIRGDPNLAVRTRYFEGDEQLWLEQQLTPRLMLGA